MPTRAGAVVRFRAVIEARRVEIVRLRNAGLISNEIMRRVERELDLEDERLQI